MFINALDEQIWVIDLPAFECLDGALMVQGTLGDVMVVCGQVLGERGIEVTSAAYPVFRKVIFPRSFKWPEKTELRLKLSINELACPSQRLSGSCAVS